jgi:hypothetical protein
MSKRKSEKTPFDVTEFIRQGKQDLEVAVSSLLETKAAPAQPQPRDTSVLAAKEQQLAASRPGIRIAALRTLGRQGEQSVFDLYTDALKLAVDLIASPESVSSGARFDCNFQLVDYSTGRARVDVWSRDLKVQWGHDFWISLGNNSGPDLQQHTTPAKWRLVPGLYIFRALVEFGRSVVYSPATAVAIRVSDSNARGEQWHRA